MSSLFSGRSAVVAAAAVGLFFSATLWADTKAADEIRQTGATTIVYHGPQVSIAFSYRYPKLNPEGKWLMLDTVMVATEAPIEVPRTAIFLRTPSGAVVPLASLTEYSKAYSELRWSITKDNATMEPLGLLAALPYVPLRYFPMTGIGVGFDSQWLDNLRNSYGRLFFKLPGSVRKGTYELLINLSESQVVIPFTL